MTDPGFVAPAFVLHDGFDGAVATAPPGVATFLDPALSEHGIEDGAPIADSKFPTPRHTRGSVTAHGPAEDDAEHVPSEPEPFPPTHPLPVKAHDVRPLPVAGNFQAEDFSSHV